MTIRLEEYRSGEYKKGCQYQFFLPSHINASDEIMNKIIYIVGRVVVVLAVLSFLGLR